MTETPTTDAILFRLRAALDRDAFPGYGPTDAAGLTDGAEEGR